MVIDVIRESYRTEWPASCSIQASWTSSSDTETRRSARSRAKTARGKQRQHMHDHVGPVRLQAFRNGSRAILAASFVFDDRQYPKQRRGPPSG